MKRRLLAAVVLVWVLLAGCDSDAARMFGFAAPLPPKPAVSVDIVCDSRGGSTCTGATLGQTCDEVLPKIADRPASTVTLWGVGETVADTTILASITVPDAPQARRAARETESRFLSTARATLMAALSGRADSGDSHRTPLAEAITRVAWSHPTTVRRFVIVISDAREESSFAQMECGELPSAKTFLADLASHHVLAPGTLARTDIQFAFVTVSRIDHDRCGVSLERADAIRSLWLAALKQAGATRVSYYTGPPQLSLAQEDIK